MARAVLKNGVICPVDDLPPDWVEGQELRIEAIDDEVSHEEFAAGMRELETMIAQNDPEECARIQQSINDARALAKAVVRKQMGLI